MRTHALWLFVLALGATGCEQRDLDIRPERIEPARGPGAVMGGPGTTPSPTAEERRPVAGRDVAGLSGQILIESDRGTMPLSDATQIEDLETRLAAAGMQIGVPDGIADAATQRALTEFQARRGLPATGRIDRQTAEALGLDWARLTTPREEIEEDLGVEEEELREDVAPGGAEKLDDAGAVIEEEAEEGERLER